MPESMVVLAHPRPGSFCHALADAVARALRDAGHVVHHHDLHDERFDPVLDALGTATTQPVDDADPLVTRHRQELVAAHTVVVVHPNWWGKPPAIMAGWMDRVLVPGVAYALPTAGGEPTPLLAGTRFVVLNTGDTEARREAELFGDPLDAIWRRCVGAFLGVRVERLLVGPMAGSSEEQRTRWSAQAARLAVSP